MEKEIEKLKLDIKVLEKRISFLERKEKRRKIFSIIKIIFILTLVIFIVIKLYNYYQEIVKLYEPFLINF